MFIDVSQQRNSDTQAEQSENQQPGYPNHGPAAPCLGNVRRRLVRFLWSLRFVRLFRFLGSVLVFHGDGLNFGGVLHVEGHILGNFESLRSGYFSQNIPLAHRQSGDNMGNVGGFPGVQKRSIRGVQLQHSAGQFLAGILVHLGEMHHGLGICDVLQVHVGLVQFHSDGLFLCDVAWDGFQLLDLVIAVGSLKGKLPIGVRLCGGDSVFSGKLDDFCIK